MDQLFKHPIRPESELWALSTGRSKGSIKDRDLEENKIGREDEIDQGDASCQDLTETIEPDSPISSSEHSLVIHCITCSRMVYITVEGEYPFSFIKTKDLGNKCIFVMTTCRQCKIGKQESGEYYPEEFFNKLRISTTLFSSCVYLNTAKIVSGKDVKILKKNRYALHVDIEKISENSTRECRIYGIHNNLSWDATHEDVLSPYIPGGFM